jgi:hypothetical protein
MLAFADVMYLLPDELTGLGRRCFALSPISFGSFQSFLFGHNYSPFLMKNAGFTFSE